MQSNTHTIIGDALPNGFIPAHKLDADQYSAEDFDGVTESLFGSGGLSYASLQASLTDATLLENAMTSTTHSDTITEGTIPDSTHPFSALSVHDGQTGTEKSAAAQEEQPVAYSHDSYGNNGAQQHVQSNEGNAITDGAIGAAGASSAGLQQGSGVFNNGSSSERESNSSSSSSSSSTSSTTTTVTRQVAGKDGAQGADGMNSTSPSDDTQGNTTFITNNITTTHNQTTNITNNTEQHTTNNLIDLGDALGDLTVILGDATTVLENLLSTLDVSHLLDLGNVTNLIGDIAHNVTGLVEQVATQIVTLTDILTDTLQSLNLGDIELQQILGDKLDLIQQLVGGTLDLLGDKAGLLQEVIGGLTEKLGELPDLHDALTMLGHLQDVGGIVQEVISLVQDNPLIETLTGDVLGGLLGGGNQGGDTDLVLHTGIELIDNGVLGGALEVGLDPVEAILGDIDLNIDVLGDLSGLLGNNNTGDTDAFLGLDIGAQGNPLIIEGLGIPLNLAEDLIGDIDLGLGLGLYLLGTESTSNATGDTDLVLQTGIDLIDDAVLGGALNVGLDPVEAILGDIDLDVNLAGNLLGGAAPALLDNAAGGSGENNLLTDVQDLGTGIIENVVQNAGGGLLGGILNGASPDDCTDSQPTPNDNLLVDLEVNALGIEGLDIKIEDPFGVVDALTGELDIEIDAALDVLGGNNLVESHLSLGDITLPAANDLLDNLGGLGGETMLPDPIGDVTQGLGTMITQPVVTLKLGFGGGLFG
jgi:hypothetical protein